MRRGIPLGGIVRVAIEYCGDDREKLHYVFEFLSYLVEMKAEKEMKLVDSRESQEHRQKKIEMKLDETVSSFIRISESMGYSASGMLTNIMMRFFGLNLRANIRKPGRKRDHKRTVSLKVPMDLYCQIKDRVGEPFNVVVRRLMRSFIESPGRFFSGGGERG